MRDAVDSPTDLLDTHLPLVAHAIAEIASRLPQSVNREGLVAAGLHGLHAATRTYDHRSGQPFGSVATSSIRRALLDQLRGTPIAAGSTIPPAAVARVTAALDLMTSISYGSVVLGGALEDAQPATAPPRPVTPKTAHYAAAMVAFGA